MLAGDRLVTIAVRPPVGGVAALTPAGAVRDAVLALDGDRLVLVPVADADRRPVANLASVPLADVDVSDRGTELAAGGDAVAHFDGALDEWLTLTAAALVGIGGAALDLGCAYAAERVAFGARIGTFQGVAHPLADDATDLDGAQLLARKAAWSLDTGEGRGRELAAMAFAFASGAAARATYDALHVHGGYGFMLEHDVQLFYRRARGWPRVWGDPDTALPPRRRPPATPPMRSLSAQCALSARIEGVAGGWTSRGGRTPRRSGGRCGGSSPSTCRRRSRTISTRPAPPTTRRSSGRWASATGSRPSGPATGSTCSGRRPCTSWRRS